MDTRSVTNLELRAWEVFSHAIRHVELTNIVAVLYKLVTQYLRWRERRPYFSRRFAACYATQSYRDELVRWYSIFRGDVETQMSDGDQVVSPTEPSVFLEGSGQRCGAIERSFEQM